MAVQVRKRARTRKSHKSRRKSSWAMPKLVTCFADKPARLLLPRKSIYLLPLVIGGCRSLSCVDKNRLCVFVLLSSLLLVSNNVWCDRRGRRWSRSTLIEGQISARHLLYDTNMGQRWAIKVQTSDPLLFDFQVSPLIIQPRNLIWLPVYVSWDY